MGMTEQTPEHSESPEELEEREVDGQHAEQLPDREVLSVLRPMNPLAPVGGEVIQPPPGES
jgi:hypothetical protein